MAVLLSGRGQALWLMALGLLTAVGVALGFVWDALGIARLPKFDWGRTPALSAAWTAFAAFIVVNLALAISLTSDIVYKDF